MKKIILTMFFVCMLSIVTMAQNIKDISKKSAEYSTVKKVVRDGYLSLYSGNTFQGSRSVSRQETAVIIDKLLTKIDRQGLNLKKSEVQELVNLAKTFKKYLVNHDINRKVVGKQISSLKSDQTGLHHDLSGMNSDIKNLKKENQDQFLFMIGGFLLAAGLGIAL
jgi:hypothetical protein